MYSYLSIKAAGVGGGELVGPADEQVAGGGIAGPLVTPLRDRGEAVDSCTLNTLVKKK